MDLLVVGGTGLLGRELTRQALAAGTRVTATAHRTRGPAAQLSTVHDRAANDGVAKDSAEPLWRTLDIRQRDAVTALLAELRPTVVVNAAYRQDDWATTADGAMHVAAAVAATGARLVHVSSDAVFSGRADRYDESAPPDPITPYGAAKAAAETAVKGLCPTAVIARTSLIIGTGDSPQERLIHRIATGPAAGAAAGACAEAEAGGKARAGGEAGSGAGAGLPAGALFTDDIRCPIHVTDLAAALLELAASPYAGMHHLAGADAISRYELGVLVARRDGLDESRLPAALRAGSGLPGALAVRLDSTRTASRLTTRLRGAREFL